MQINEMRGVMSFQAFIESTGNAASTGNLPVWVAPYDCEITAITLLPSAAITADATNFATYTATRHAAGASATTVATRLWSATNSVAVTEESMTLSATAANLLLTSGQTLTMVKTVGGTGLIIPALLVKVLFKWTGV